MFDARIWFFNDGDEFFSREFREFAIVSVQFEVWKDGQIDSYFLMVEKYFNGDGLVVLVVKFWGFRNVFNEFVICDRGDF